MTPIELHRLAAATACLRPDWPASSLQTFLQRHLAHRPLRDIAVALTWIAVDPASVTPARVLEAGPWWGAAASSDHPTAVNDCPRHPEHGLRVDARTGASKCSGCHVDASADDAAQARFERRPVPDEVRRRLATPSRATGADTPENRSQEVVR